MSDSHRTINAVAITSDGGCIVAGYTKSNDGDVSYNHLLSDCWVIKLNNAGEIQWQKTYGGKANDEANAIIQTSDGGYMIAGYTASEDGDPGIAKRFGTDGWMIKINSTGNIEWQKSFNGKGSEAINSIRQTRDGGFVFAAIVRLAGYDIAESKGGDDFLSENREPWRDSMAENIRRKRKRYSIRYTNYHRRRLYCCRYNLFSGWRCSKQERAME